MSLGYNKAPGCTGPAQEIPGPLGGTWTVGPLLKAFTGIDLLRKSRTDPLGHLLLISSNFQKVD
jgi:hypothetical protein